MAGAGSWFARHETFQALESRDFRFLLLGTLLVQLTLPIQFLTQIFWVQEHYPDREVLYAGLLAASRGVAMLGFGLVGGAIADRYERRRVLFVNQCISFGLNGLIAVLMVFRPFDAFTIWPLLLLTLSVAGTYAVDFPTRQASMPSIVGMAKLSNAISLNMIAMQLAIPLTLPVVGFLNEFFAPGPIYAGSLATWALILPAIAALQFTSQGTANRAVGVLSNVVEGMRYVRRDAIIFGVVAIVIVIQLIGMPGVSHLGPVWMTSVLGLSEGEFGLIAMTWGIGALTASFFMAKQQSIARKGVTLCIIALGFAACVIVFGHSRFIPLTALANFGLGFCMVGTMVGAATITQHVATDEMRGRVMGLFPLGIGLSMLAAAPVSGAGQIFGLPAVVPTLGWLALALAALVIFRTPELRNASPAPLENEPAIAAGGE